MSYFCKRMTRYGCAHFGGWGGHHAKREVAALCNMTMIKVKLPLLQHHAKLCMEFALLAESSKDLGLVGFGR